MADMGQTAETVGATDATPEVEPTTFGRRGHAWRWPITVLGVLLTLFALAHSLEDFAYDVPTDRFDLNATLAAVLLAGAFFVQVVILAAAWRATLLGYWAALGVAIAWFVAAALDHTGDLLDESFREGFASDILIVGILLSSLLLALSAGAALWRRLHY